MKNKKKILKNMFRYFFIGLGIVLILMGLDWSGENAFIIGAICLTILFIEDKFKSLEKKIEAKQ